MTLVFKSDGSKNAAGFEAQYTSRDNNTALDSGSQCRFVSHSQVMDSAFVFGVLQ